MKCCAEIPIPCLLVSRAVTTWGVSGASRAGDGLARAILPWHRGCEHCGFNIKCVGGRTEPLVCLFHPSFLHLCTKLTNPFWKFDDVMPHPVFLKLRPVLHEQTRLCSPHQAKIRNVEGNQRERLICQILSAGSFITLSRSFQAAVEASAYLGLLMWLVGKQTQRSSSMGLLHLGSTWD